LKEYSYESTPSNWKFCQKNLGDLLRILGEREADTEQLERSVTAYKEALKEYTLEHTPEIWAEIKSNLDGLVKSPS
jgi:hypothetical protein